ncbi:NADH-quinone oxidoreductase subunit C [Candidatus Bathyarchaeota archaeon]|nr:NADH-quinone oxidoreductase subunit C [Candidatus Bathyarchaeota archaeon]
MMQASNLIKAQLKGATRGMIIPRERRMSIPIAKEQLRKTIKKLIGLEGFTHLSTITGVDVGPQVELIYHLAYEDALVSLRVRVWKENPILPTIVDLIPGAVLYEREIHDLFGVGFEGNLDLSPLILPDTWPEGIFPLRKEWTPERISEKIEDDNENH